MTTIFIKIGTQKHARETQREDDRPSTCQEERALKKPDDPII